MTHYRVYGRMCGRRYRIVVAANSVEDALLSARRLGEWLKIDAQYFAAIPIA